MNLNFTDSLVVDIKQNVSFLRLVRVRNVSVHFAHLGLTTSLVHGELWWDVSLHDILNVVNFSIVIR